MKTVIKYFWQFVCLFLLIVIIFLRQCTPKSEQPTNNTTHTDTVTVTITHTDTITEHIPGQEVHDTIYSDVPFDTLDLITDYFKVIISNDTLRGENYMIAIRDVISRNRIQKRTAVATVKMVVQTIHTIDSIYYTTDCPKARNKVYAGFGIGGWTDKIGLAPTLALNTKKDNLYTVSYDVINKTAWINLYWKFKLRR